MIPRLTPHLAAPVLALTALIASPVHAMTPNPYGLSSLTLQEPSGKTGIHLIPGQTLQTGYASSFFASRNGITLQTDGTQPVIRHHSAPETLLRETNSWFYQQTVSNMSATLHVDHLPGNGQITIARLTSAQHPIAELRIEGDRVLATITNGTAPQTVTVGTTYPQDTLNLSITTFPNGLLTIVVNGTESHFAMPNAATAQPVWFEAVAGQNGFQKTTHSNMARVTFRTLTIQHRAT